MSLGIPCPRCRNPLVTGSRMCPSCARCGVFGCAVCLAVGGNLVVCRKRLPPPRLAWEDSSRFLPVRFVVTVWSFLTSPLASAREVKNGSVGWAWLFAALCMAVQFGGWALFLHLADARAHNGLEGGTILIAFGWLLILPLGEFLTLRAMGEEVPFTTHLRTTAYSSAAFVLPWCACGGLLFWAPLLRLLTLRSAFRLTWFQALIAVSTLPLVLTCAIVVTRFDLRFWI